MYVPVELKITLAVPAIPPDRVRVLLATNVPEQAASEYTLKVTVPAGLKPPVTMAVSEMDPPTVTVNTDSVVVTVGVALLTMSVSEPHGLRAGALFESPEYEACHV